MRHILIADDDKEIAQLIRIYLENEGFQTRHANDGHEALAMLKGFPADLIVLDIMMPGMDGMEVCRKVREHSAIPILMLSAKTQDMDKVLGLMTGADDYMSKPFNPLELSARVKSLLRRSFQYNTELKSEVSEHVLKLDAIEINKLNHEVTANGKPISLTSREFEILSLLASSPGRVFGAEEIFRLIWQESYFVSNNTVMVHISNLRDKLEKELGYKLIQTVWGVGYKIEK
ncbi:response regulator transcription factor [Paenibacillus koleovorans]|uniref:response regulator transcription factor n=1 Tax=Paenibacillus koleovorans TaxID=121608 RepID=UPI000FDBF2D3|nr:response regulator transcription factor [Paenibacillus koleovorans]